MSDDIEQEVDNEEETAILTSQGDITEEEESAVFRSHPHDYETHPKIRRLLRNPRVREVHIKLKASGGHGRQPYVCILFRNGSVVERPLRDIAADEEEPSCHSTNPSDRYIQTVPQARPVGYGRRAWNIFRRGRHNNRNDDIAAIISDNDDIVVKRVVTVVKKGCYNNPYNNRRRNPRIQIQDYEIEE